MVSIHARVKRATDASDSDYHITAVSIHARVKRATGYLPVDSAQTQVSIHARVKRATSATATITALASGFNPRPREAGDA